MRSPRRPLLALLAAVLAIALAACTPGADAPLVDDTEVVVVQDAGADRDPPAIPTPADPPTGGGVPPSTEGGAGRPERGPVVLVHLEGPTTDLEATDLVVRTERGEEIDRFRVAGAIEVHAASGGRHALIRTSDGRWARYDAVRSGLSLLTFDGPAPAGPPRVAGPTAWWGDPERPWVVRLDTGRTTSLADLVDITSPTIQATADGAHLLVRATRDHLVTTADGTVRTLPGQTTVTLAADGSGLASTAPGVAGSDVYVEALDGGGRRLVGTVSGEGHPVLLPDGRVLVLGPDSSLIGTDGSQADLPPAAGVTECDVALDGLRVLCATAAQLVLVDAAAVSITPIGGSTGMTLAADQAPADVLWAISTDPAAPGVVAVDATDGSITALLPDLPTTALIGLAADATTALLRVGPSGEDVAVVALDGRTEITPAGPGASLHPDGASLAVGVLDGTSRTLRLTGPGGPPVELPTGRAPAWLRTTPPDVDPGA